MSDTWKFLKAEEVYAYPSANATDGGDVNSEINIAGISNHLVQKNFIINENTNPKPLWVSITNNKINVYKGSVILNGYYINLTPLNGSNYIISYNLSDIIVSDEFINNYSRVWEANHYSYDPVKGKVITPRGATKLPKIHLVIKLVSNITGNLRGDLLVRNTSGENVLTCRACAYSFVTDLSTVDAPYIDIAQILIDPSSTTTNLEILKIINPDDRSSYINIDSVYSEDENGNIKPLSDFIKDTVEVNGLSKIIHYSYDTGDTGHTGPRIKDLEISVDNGEPRVVRYEKSSGYNDEGDYNVREKTGYDDTYSIDDIQKRTHVSSSTAATSAVNQIAHQVDPRDDGAGKIRCTPDEGSPILADNGTSNLIARADHTHDERYIVSKAGLQTGTQEIGTSLNIDGDIINEVISTNKNTTTPIVNITGDLTATGDIRANKVYNAVWNDYAELYKKEYPYEQYEEGTVICKELGKDTYSASDYKRRKLVVGVVTNSYGHLLGGDKELSLEENLQKYVPVSLSGRVLVKVLQGKVISEGDLLVVSASGHGIANTDDYPEPGTVIGKALESSDGSKDKILMQVMLG